MSFISKVRNVSFTLEQCYIPFNKPQDGKPRSYPLCAIQLISAMRGAKDSETCIRRSNLVTNLNPSKYCDPMGDENIITTLKAVQNNETRPNDSVIVVATRVSQFLGGDSLNIVFFLRTFHFLFHLQYMQLVFQDEMMSCLVSAVCV